MPYSTQSKSTRINPRAIIGGTFEAFEDIFETVTGTGTGSVNEGPVQQQDFEAIQKSPELKANKSMPDKGSIIFNYRRSQELSQEMTKAASDKGKKEALKARRTEVNQKIGISNLSYEDTVSEDFILRADVQADLDKANSELEQNQLKNKKENMISQATNKAGLVAGTDHLRDGENRNMQQPG